MRRKPGHLVPLEQRICEAAVNLQRHGHDEFHGYELAKHLAAAADRRFLTSYGTLYRALGRLEQFGFLRSRWEDPQVPGRENRPPRRLYTLTPAGEAAASQADELEVSPRRRGRQKLAQA
jgi:DNA-binding PadR family transcriptional regulator